MSAEPRDLVEESRRFRDGLAERRTAYARGYRAATDGSANPYEAGSRLHESWESGLRHAREDWS